MAGFGVLGGALGSFQAPPSRACSYLQPAAGIGSGASPGFLGILPRDPGWPPSPPEGQDELRRCHRSLPRPKSRDLGSSGPALHSPTLPRCRSPRRARSPNIPWRISQFLGKLSALPAPHQAPAGLGINLGFGEGSEGAAATPQPLPAPGAPPAALRAPLETAAGSKQTPGSLRIPADPCGSREPPLSLCPCPRVPVPALAPQPIPRELRAVFGAGMSSGRIKGFSCPVQFNPALLSCAPAVTGSSCAGNSAPEAAPGASALLFQLRIRGSRRAPEGTGVIPQAAPTGDSRTPNSVSWNNSDECECENKIQRGLKNRFQERGALKQEKSQSRDGDSPSSTSSIKSGCF